MQRAGLKCAVVAVALLCLPTGLSAAQGQNRGPLAAGPHGSSATSAKDRAASSEDDAKPLLGPRQRTPETPETLYERGLRQMRRGYHDEAIVSFDKVRNHFPFNQYSVLAELRVADCLYEKGSFMESVDAYSQFTRLHPRHDEVDYALYRAARAQFRLSPLVAQRDQSNTRRGLKKLAGFEARFPESEYLGEVERLRQRASTRLARYKLQVGNFYWKSKEWAAAERRYRLAFEEFPDSVLAGKALLRRALCLRKLGRESEAIAVLEALVSRGEGGKEESRWVERGRKALGWETKDAPPTEPSDAPPSESSDPAPTEPSDSPPSEPSDPPPSEPSDPPPSEPSAPPASESSDLPADSGDATPADSDAP